MLLSEQPAMLYAMIMIVVLKVFLSQSRTQLFFTNNLSHPTTCRFFNATRGVLPYQFIQAVIPNPISIYGRKVDFSFYVFVAALDPLRLYIGEGA